MIQNRRSFLSLLALSSLGKSLAIAAADRPTKRVLLRSSWQTVNIGDIAHTPGVLQIIETHLPDVEVTLWPSRVDNGVKELLQERFPKLKFAPRDSNQLAAAFEECDFLLHGSGASFVAERDVRRWHEETGKPFGVYGITLPKKKSSSTVATTEAQMARTIDLLSKARFVFFRDSKSLALAKQKGCRAPIMAFGPDGAFGCDLKDDRRAIKFLNENGLEEGKFMCCIPRLRYTPYWRIKDVPFDPVKHARNEQMKEHDHAPLRKAIVEVVRQTEMKVLVCPEDRTQMAVGKELLVDPLPDRIRRRVVWRPDYWLTGEAIGTYARSAGLFGNEMHSPIMCIAHGVPAIVCRWAEQTTKGYMWQDIGLSDWLFNLDNEDQVERVVPAVLQIATDPKAAREKAAAAHRFVLQRQKETMSTLSMQLT